MGKQWKQWQTLFRGGLQNHYRLWLKPWNYKTLALLRNIYDQPRQHIKKQKHYFANSGPSSQSYVFSSSHVWMWEMDFKENWVLKNWCFWTVVLEKILENPLDCKEIKPVNPKGNQPWILEWLMLKLQWFSHLMWGANSLEKTLMLRKIEGWKRRATEDETIWMASPTQNTWVWESSRRWWNTREPGMQQSTGSQRVRHNWIATTRNSFLHHYLLQASST